MDQQSHVSRVGVATILDQYYAAFNAGSKQAVLDVFTEDAVFIDQAMEREMNGRDELAGFIDHTWLLSPYFRLEPTQIVIDGSHAAVRLLMSGARAIDAAGRPDPRSHWKIPSTSFFEFREHRISRKEDCWNVLAIPKQIGWLRVLPMLLRS